jgi:CarD family transcriptional regulator
MNFTVGETLVYPHHGAVTITEIQSRTIKGVDKQFMTLKVHASDLTIQLPIENVELVGVRDVIDADGVKAVFDVLRDPFVEEPVNWSRRYKANQEKMASGSVYRVGEVVRDLWRRDHDSGVSAGEKRMLQKARQILVSELALALRSSDDEAGVALDEVLSGTVVAAEPAS